MITHFKEIGGCSSVWLKRKSAKDFLCLHSQARKILPPPSFSFFLSFEEQVHKQRNRFRQEVTFLAKELSDAVVVQDKTMADLHIAHLRKKADAMAELKLNAVEGKRWVAGKTGELRREVDDLKLCLQMVTDHYKGKKKK